MVRYSTLEKVHVLQRSPANFGLVRGSNIPMAGLAVSYQNFGAVLSEKSPRRHPRNLCAVTLRTGKSTTLLNYAPVLGDATITK
jgi:hypothetical protein